MYFSESAGYETCGLFPIAIGDNVCDDMMNTPQCDYDGNDCCKPWSYFGFCQHCKCHDPDFELFWTKYIHKNS